MAYRALYREYRPRTFYEVIGQEHITTILKNQVRSGHVAHAYLFCGTRGTGKTSTAKIFARAVNCLDSADGEPCGRCEGCMVSADGNNTDILELDAASNNSVDDVRAIIEQAQYAPLKLTKRVFIIDEAHMLSGAAFNALLKTLEEPPAHILFILATTEPQKLPATILSRCQRFDFYRLSSADIVQTLKSVLNKAGAEIDEDGLMLIARTADGGMRDALSLADQCLSFCGDRVTKSDVYDVLGSMEDGFLFEIADALLASDAKKVLTMLDGIVRGGRDLSVFCQDLSAHLRALLLSKTCGDCQQLLDCTDDAMQRYKKQAESASQARLLLAMETILSAQGEMRYLSSPRTLLESALIRICRPEDVVSIDALTARVDRLESRAAVAAPVANTPTQVIFSRVEAGKPTPAPDAEDYLPPPPPEEDGYAFEPDVDERPAPAPAPNKRVSPAGADKARAVSPAASRSEAPRAQTMAHPASALDGTDAGAVWNALLSELYKQNILIHALAKDGIAQGIQNDALIIGYDEKHTGQYRGLSAPINLNKMQQILNGVRQGLRLTLVEIKAQNASDADVERAKALFGDKLTIKE